MPTSAASVCALQCAGQQHDSPPFAVRGQAGRADENTRERQGAGGDLRSGGEDQRRCLPGPSGWPPQPYHHRAGGSAEAGAGAGAFHIDSINPRFGCAKCGWFAPRSTSSTRRPCLRTRRRWRMRWWTEATRWCRAAQITTSCSLTCGEWRRVVRHAFRILTPLRACKTARHRRRARGARSRAVRHRAQQEHRSGR